MTCSYLLISEDPQDESFVNGVSEECRGRAFLKTPTQLNWSDPMLSQATGLFIGTCSKSFSTELSKFLSRESFDRNRLFILSQENNISEMDSLLLETGAGHFLIRKSNNVLEVGRFFGKLMGLNYFNSKNKEEDQENFLPCSKIAQVYKFNESLQKNLATFALSRYLINDLRCQKRFASVVIGAVDELLMNAMYDAPVDFSNSQVHAKTSRATNLDLSGSNVEMKVEVNSENIAITIVDKVGSLDRLQILKHVSKSFGKKMSIMKDTEYVGAGVGLALIFRSGGSLLFKNEIGRQTSASVFFGRPELFRDIKNHFQFLSTLVFPGITS